MVFCIVGDTALIPWNSNDFRGLSGRILSLNTNSVLEKARIYLCKLTIIYNPVLSSFTIKHNLPPTTPHLNRSFEREEREPALQSHLCISRRWLFYFFVQLLSNKGEDSGYFASAKIWHFDRCFACQIVLQMAWFEGDFCEVRRSLL